MTMFEVDPIHGVIERKERSETPHYFDHAGVSPWGKSFNESDIPTSAMNTEYPSEGFGLKLHVFYSKSFKDEFGSGTKSK